MGWSGGGGGRGQLGATENVRALPAQANLGGGAPLPGAKGDTRPRSAPRAQRAVGQAGAAAARIVQQQAVERAALGPRLAGEAAGLPTGLVRPPPAALRGRDLISEYLTAPPAEGRVVATAAAHGPVPTPVASATAGGARRALMYASAEGLAGGGAQAQQPAPPAGKSSAAAGAAFAAQRRAASAAAYQAYLGNAGGTVGGQPGQGAASWGLASGAARPHSASPGAEPGRVINLLGGGRAVTAGGPAARARPASAAPRMGTGRQGTAQVVVRGGGFAAGPAPSSSVAPAVGTSAAANMGGVRGGGAAGATVRSFVPASFRPLV
jgi:hypothetical protein